ncbi:MAG: hypothetical protein NTX71_11190 [Candidatus Aureabacteria bacterium]|nr:hypothetical protein [Candidatus Auribacterota bacterium]
MGTMDSQVALRRGTVSMVEGNTGSNSEATRRIVRPLNAAGLERLVIRAGFTCVVMRGDYAGNPFDREAFRDLILSVSRPL